jgi:hypothetical protein
MYNNARERRTFSRFHHHAQLPETSTSILLCYPNSSLYVSTTIPTFGASYTTVSFVRVYAAFLQVLLFLTLKVFSICLQPPLYL